VNFFIGAISIKEDVPARAGGGHVRFEVDIVAASDFRGLWDDLSWSSFLKRGKILGLESFLRSSSGHW
jgi:hypothetical protein